MGSYLVLSPKLTKLDFRELSFCSQTSRVLQWNTLLERVSPWAHILKNYLSELMRLPERRNTLRRYLGIAIFYKKKVHEIELETQYVLQTGQSWDAHQQNKCHFREHFELVTSALTHAWALAFKQPILGQQLVFMTDASFRRSGYTLLI